MMTLPRSEYPRPQCVRPDWLCLNGEWQFEIDSGDSGLERGLLERELTDRILVPFCPESSLSGIGKTDFLTAVWYRRTVTIPSDWAGQRVLLHFQAVDHDATIWVNGQELGRHRGGFTPFSVELPAEISGQEATIVVRARDYNHIPQARGKQTQTYHNVNCDYTRTTGIWQTVWLEPVPEVALLRPRLTPDVANGLLRLVQPLSTPRTGLTIRASLRDSNGVVCTASCATGWNLSPQVDLSIPEERRVLWSPEHPHLYDLEILLLNGEQVIDQISSYAGLRSVSIEGPAILLNGQKLFQRLVLDQGYYPDGILTAPDDEALIRDITLSMEAGFNGARLHQKVFEERFLYHADRLGYLVWGEFADWGCGGYGPQENHQQPTTSYITQWLEALERDYSHPAIIGWCPLNETWQPLTDHITILDDVTRAMFLATKAFDQIRPVLDTSGYSHRVAEADIYDSHDYEQNPTLFAANHAYRAEGKRFINDHQGRPISLPYRHQPYMVSEFGGIWWNDTREPGDRTTSWGYGTAPQSIDEFYARFEGLCKVLLDNPTMFGYCYTQLTDVFQEQNGIYTFDRRPKFDLARLHAIQGRTAAIEQ
ncbi:MAG TPA: beta-galactosidase [Ktedonobacteraceae bacterium]|nr:beta-galactosidase [Ktedonobacteraceae bacterium]